MSASSHTDVGARAGDVACDVRLTSVDVWLVDLTDDAISEPLVVHMLDPEERRCAAARAGAGRRRYVAAHAALRMILGSILEVDAASVRFRRTCGRCGAQDHGRPWVAEAAPLDFSIGHSGDRAIVAVSDGVQVGADIEAVRPRVHLQRLARRVLDPTDHAEWSALSGERALASFLEAWTAKEAYLKATGEGITRRLSGVPRAATPGWSLARPETGGGYVAAVVARSEGLRIRYRLPVVATGERGAP